MLSDFDTEGMSKPQKFVYFMKNYGLAYTSKKVLKKLGVKIDPETEYVSWCRRISYTKDELKSGMADVDFNKYAVLIEKASENSNQDAALKSVKKASNGKAKVFTDLSEALGSGADYIVLADDNAAVHEDFFIELNKAVKENEGAEVIYSDEDSLDGKKRFRPYWKPDKSPELLLNFQYLGSVFTVKKSLFADICETENREVMNNHWYTVALDAFDKTDKVVHIKRAIFSNMTGSSDYVRCLDNSQKASLEKYVKANNIDAEVTCSDVRGFYHLKRNLARKPLVSIIIPNYEHADDLKICIDSLFEVNTYENIEVIIAENNSKEQSTFDYYKELEETNPKVKVVYWKDEFNYSAINNFAVEYSKGEILLFLNNDTQIINPEAIEELVIASTLPGAGASGAMLYYADDTIQHAGVIIGMGGFAAHALWSLTDRDEKYYPFSVTSREMGGVTGACLMMKREAFEKVGGFDVDFRVALNDIDLCMKVREAGYEIVFTPYAKLYHFESKSRGYEDTMEKQARFQKEIDRFQTKWQKELEAGDEYYNPNLTLHRADYSMDI